MSRREREREIERDERERARDEREERRQLKQQRGGTEGVGRWEWDGWQWERIVCLCAWDYVRVCARARVCVWRVSECVLGLKREKAYFLCLLAYTTLHQVVFVYTYTEWSNHKRKLSWLTQQKCLQWHEINSSNGTRKKHWWNLTTK